jgi:hypothetical protein
VSVWADDILNTTYGSTQASLDIADLTELLLPYPAEGLDVATDTPITMTSRGQR